MVNVCQMGHHWTIYKKFVDYYGLPIDLSSFDNDHLTLAHAYVRHVIQTLVPFRIGLVEGGHRFEFAIRTFYGVPVQPRVDTSVQEGFALQFPPECVMMQPIVMHQLQYSCGIHNITPRMIKSLRKKSENISIGQKSMVETSWRQLAIKITEEIPHKFPEFNNGLHYIHD